MCVSWLGFEFSGRRVTSIQQPDAEAAKTSQNTQKDLAKELSKEVIGCAVEVQRHLGTGLLESAYAAAMAIELETQGFRFHREWPVSAKYKGHEIGLAYRADFVVEDQLLIELKAVDAVLDVHRAQVLSYLRLGGLKLGLLINFHAFPVAPRGITRIANQL
jgi:GxxExxY protein